jgi:DNA polymerase-3 subunit delta'
VVGQPRAVAALQAAAVSPVHAYLLVGPAGVGKRTAARAFAATLLGDEAAERVMAGLHPDVSEYEREGARLSVGDAREITRLALRSPIEGDRKVILIPELDLAAQIAPALLKTLEEPPPGTVFVGMAEHVPTELATIASRCVRIDFGPIPIPVLVAALTEDGVDPAQAAEVAEAAGGSLARARLLASDPGFVARRARWASVPDRLDGTGAAVAVLTDELLASADELIEPLRLRQAAEVEELEARAARYGERGLGGGGRKGLTDRHKREQRRVRMDELRAGLATLAGAYRDRLTQGGQGARSAAAALRAVEIIGDTAESLERNPNETLLVQALLVRLTDGSRAPALA